MSVRYERDTKEFVKWCSSKITLSPKISICDLRNINQGRGVVAKENIAIDEVTFEISRSLLINTKTSGLLRDYPSLADFLLDELDQWQNLIVVLYYEMYILNTCSQWSQYLNVLSRPHEMNSLLYWSADELRTLRPSLILDRVGEAQARDMLNDIKTKLIKKNDAILQRISEMVWDDFLYIASLVMSYSFDVEDPNDHTDSSDEEENYSDDYRGIRHDGYLKSMVPLADTLNADTRMCNATLTYDVETLKMRAIEPILAGQQLFNFYGDFSNGELLRRYGYVEWLGSKYEIGEIRLDNVTEICTKVFSVIVDVALIEEVLEILDCSSEILELFDGHSIVLPSYDCTISGEISPEIVCLLQVLSVVLRDHKFNELNTTDKERRLLQIVMKCYKLVTEQKITETCRKLLNLCIDARLNEYPTHAFREPKPRTHDCKEYIPVLRQQMATTVLYNEVRALQRGFITLKNHYEIVYDDVLLSKELKRTIGNNKYMQRSKAKRSKN